ncbi:MAG: chemotaxis protein CheC [Betaproteobacteria bacterium]|nr:chemotaxis protein CheC [Betaproteobacteria bacterium]
MTLSPAEHDAVAELANIGISRAARQLSLMLDDEIRIQRPRVSLVTARQAARELGGESGDVACVYQRMSGPCSNGECPKGECGRSGFSGRIMLVLPSQDSRVLFHRLIGISLPLQGVDLRSFEHEAMTEIGNIIISSCVSAMADMLRQHITVSIPRYAETRIESLFNDGEQGENSGGAEQPALIVHARLHAANRSVQGVIVLAFSSNAARYILAAIRRIAGGQLNGSP